MFRITKKVKIPLPIIDDQIDSLGGKKVFIALDLKTGFQQLAMHPDSIGKTSFVTPDGQYEFLRVPFGLCNASGYFQDAMRKALYGLPVFIYIDDIFIAAYDVDEVFKMLKLVLQALKKFNFTLNLEKCRFFLRKIDYLGREISQDGVRPGPTQKILAVQNASIPKNVKQVQQFLGLVRFFRKFVKDFSKTVTPLTSLLRKKCKVELGK